MNFFACERIEPKLQFHRRSCREILSPSAWKPLFTTESQTQPWRSVITSLYGWMFKQWAKLSKFSVSFEKSKGDDGIFVLCERPPPFPPLEGGKINNSFQVTLPILFSFSWPKYMLLSQTANQVL